MLALPGPAAHTDIATISLQDSSCLTRTTTSSHLSDIATCVGSAAGLAAIACLIACLPLSSFWALGAVMTSVFVATALFPTKQLGATAVDPLAIADDELRAGYRQLCEAHGELCRVLTARGDNSAAALAMLDGSRDAVVLCGRIAYTTNGLARHLAARDVDAIAADEARLRDAAASDGDPERAKLVAATADARAHEVATLRRLVGLRDRALARIHLATASVRMATAGLVQQHAIDDEQLVLASGSVSDATCDLATELEALSTVNAMCAANAA